MDSVDPHIKEQSLYDTDPHVKVYYINNDLHRVGQIRLDSRVRLLLKGGVIVYDHTDGAFQLIAIPSPENIEEAKAELIAEREQRMDWATKKIKRY